MFRTAIIIGTIILITPSLVLSQMKRERVTGQPNEAIAETFWAPKLVGMSTVETVGANNLNVTIMHNFGPLNQQPVQNFLGLDFGATVRLGLDYGITESWSMGIGRTSRFRIYDLGSKFRLLQQNRGGTIPFTLALKGNIGVNTNENGFTFNQRLNYLGSAIIARKFSDIFSFQLNPMYAHFNRVRPEEQNGHFALGLGAELHLSDRFALMAEYLPVIGERSPGTKDAISVGLNIETGGHVFQLFFKSSNWHTEQHIISQNTEAFWAGDIRFGFNVNRVFWLGSER